MLAHLFKLIWNKKKQNFLIMLELFFSFLVMFAVFTLVINFYYSYRQPRGFDYDNVWTIQRTAAQSNAGSGGNELNPGRDSAVLSDQLLRQQIKSMPEIRDVSYSSGNTPYSNTSIMTYLAYKKLHEKTPLYIVEDSYARLLNIPVLEGRWFSADDDAANYIPAVINEHLKEKLFGSEDALAKIVEFGNRKYKVIGVVNDVKDKSDYTEPGNGFYVRADSTFYGNNQHILVKIKPGTNARFEAKLFKSLSSAMKNTSIEIIHLDDKRISENKEQIIPVIILLIVVLFLIINVALGLFGVLWHNINKRKGEIGLRRAVGASGSNISKQLVTEALVLSTISLIVGSFFAIQFPIMNIFDIAAKTYLLALVLAILFIYLLAIICSLYPGRQAAAIYPAVALHEE